MYNTETPSAIATIQSNCKGDIASRIIERNRRRIADALADGCDYLRMKKLMPRDTFKIWLESIGKTAAEAIKYAKLYQVFASFSIEAIAQLSLSTLFALCQKRYQQLVAKLRSMGNCSEGMVIELMAQEREQHKPEKPKRERTGLVNLPCGGRAFQFPLLHDDKAIAQILRIQEYRQDATLTQLAAEAIALLFEQEDRLHRQGRCVEGTSTPCRPRSLHLNEYRIGARSVKDWHHDKDVALRFPRRLVVRAKVLQRATEEEIAT